MMVSIQRFARILSNAAFLAATNLWQMMNKAQKNEMKIKKVVQLQSHCRAGRTRKENYEPNKFIQS